MEETLKAKQAFEDYYALGPGRSLSKLAEAYRSRTEPDPPTRELTTLKEWSSEHGWQARLDQRIEEESQALRKAMRERNLKALESGELIIDTSLARALKALQADPDATVVESAKDLETVLKLRGQIAGEPLPERQEHTGAGGGPIEHAVLWWDGIAEAQEGQEAEGGSDAERDDGAESEADGGDGGEDTA